MPELPQRNDQFSNGSSPMYSTVTNGFWSKNRDDVSYNQLQKFWSELSPQARQDLLRIDKQTLFEQARKNMYCSRCNGLLLEGFLQIVMYGKSLQQEGTSEHIVSNRNGAFRYHDYGGSRVINEDEIQDPSVHPWGGLTTTRDVSLTLMDCYLYSKSLKGLQTVFDSARARERERELLYPDACGGGGRGWISQGLVSYGRGHGIRETCALHTARLSCDTLVDFWSALGEETRQSLLRMKEEDFIERLMFRFDNKRFCRDCRRNVIREFKELKELKRMRREPRCTGWFCVADTAFQYEVSDYSIQADWHQTFADTLGMYHHFEWAVGTSEGKCDILEFENVGMNGSVQVNGLDLSGFGACFITLRAFKSDGRCSEISVKAHALKGQQCVHSRLVVGDGYVTITKGESIRRFFEHAEEAEEEEDDDSMDKDGNELDGECSRPQKHAKSPELAREFLLDAAIVIFKEQVEKAFREGTARQNAHSIFVCLALKLLEDRIHVACKEIVTLEKQMKLLEEEEKEKRDEEERKERRRTKEREKKLRRKERLKGKEKDKEKKCSESSEISYSPEEISKEDTSPIVNEEQNNTISYEDSIEEMGATNTCDIHDEESSNDCGAMRTQSYYYDGYDGDYNHSKIGADNCTAEQSRFTHWKLKYTKEAHLDMSLKWSDRRRYAVSENGSVSSRSDTRHNGSNRQLRTNMLKSNGRNSGTKFYSGSRLNDRYDSHTCSSCNQSNEYRVKIEPYSSVIRHAREPKPVNKSESAADTSKQFHRGCKYNQADYTYESCGRPKSRLLGNNRSRDQVHSKKVWEPLESQKRCPRSISDSDVTLRSATFEVEAGSGNNIMNSPEEIGFGESGDLANDINSTSKGSCGTGESYQINLQMGAKGSCILTEVASSSSTLNLPANLTLSSTSNSDNCSSCLSEGDSNATSNHRNMVSSTTSDSEDASQRSEGRETSVCNQNAFSECHEFGTENIQKTNMVEKTAESMQNGPSSEEAGSGISGNPSVTISQSLEHGSSAASPHQTMFPPMVSRGMQFHMFQPPSTMGYYHKNPVSWPGAPANGLMHFPHPNHYMYAAPLGYGLSENSQFCMHYGDLQHLTTSMFNPAAIPVYQPVVRSSNVDEQCTGFKPPSRREHTKGVAVLPGEAHSNKPSSNGEVGQADDSAKSHTSNDSFSLFHFGGPVALSTASDVNSAPSKGGTGEDFTWRDSADNLEHNPNCIRKDTTSMEEYSLFAGSDRLKFFNFLKG